MVSSANILTQVADPVNAPPSPGVRWLATAGAREMTRLMSQTHVTWEGGLRPPPRRGVALLDQSPANALSMQHPQLLYREDYIHSSVNASPAAKEVEEAKGTNETNRPHFAPKIAKKPKEPKKPMRPTTSNPTRPNSNLAKSRTLPTSVQTASRRGDKNSYPFPQSNPTPLQIRNQKIPNPRPICYTPNQRTNRLASWR